MKSTISHIDEFRCPIKGTPLVPKCILVVLLPIIWALLEFQVGDLFR